MGKLESESWDGGQYLVENEQVTGHPGGEVVVDCVGMASPLDLVEERHRRWIFKGTIPLRTYQRYQVGTRRHSNRRFTISYRTSDKSGQILGCLSSFIFGLTRAWCLIKRIVVLWLSLYKCVMTAAEEAQNTPSNGPKKRFIGKARAEALRRKAVEQNSGPSIEDAVVTARGIGQVLETD